MTEGQGGGDAGDRTGKTYRDEARPRDRWVAHRIHADITSPVPTHDPHVSPGLPKETTITFIGVCCITNRYWTPTSPLIGCSTVPDVIA